jgi:hypothetical protein
MSENEGLAYSWADLNLTFMDFYLFEQNFQILGSCQRVAKQFPDLPLLAAQTTHVSSIGLVIQARAHC